MRKSARTFSFSAADAAFLFLERKEFPMHIASVCIFDGPIPFKQFVANIKSKLPLMPLYRKIPVVLPWSLEFPTWQDDPKFDIRRHIFQVTLDAPGGETELQALAGRLLSEVLDRNKPMWEIHLVDGLKDGRGAMIWRVHHALCDGVSAVESMKILLDTTPEASLKIRRVRPQPKAKTVTTKGRDGFAGAVNNVLENLVSLETGLLNVAQGFLGAKDQTALKEIAKILPEYVTSVERLPFNKRCTGTRKFCWAEVSMGDVQKIREAEGGTVNDIVLAVLARGLSRYVKLHGESADKRFVRVMCPVSLRPPDQNGTPGNQISFLLRVLPLDVHGPIEMLHALSQRTETLKKSGAIGLAALAAKWLTTVPPLIQSVFWRNITDLIFPLPIFNLICTNVAGSSMPLYAGGRRMLAAYPQVPTGYDLGVGFAVHSYDGKLFFGLLADTDAAPDVERLRDFLIQAFEELQRAVASKKSRRARRAPRKRSETHKRAAEPARTAVPQPSPRTTAPEASPAPNVEHKVEAA